MRSHLSKEPPPQSSETTAGPAATDYSKTLPCLMASG
jgi:hypothetical protein